ncbi:MAG: hypothetical protein JWN21_2137 [Sphingomonas bacterium]|uniref:circadian clock KaiB family protein n=1 Tax=Sphingomonas bacterium TaxID=1895847 RepID=UPI00260A3603|nr:circadian clock KaiB family protein [Sphingomonas bacterium]MDB5696594.1 hypothetical protein [Sphingomonas bacterium]
MSAGEDRHVLRLFVSGASPRSTRAIDNLRRLLERELPGRYDLRVIDVYQDPEAARDHQVVAAPTLVKVSPLPVRRIIGDLSDEARVLHGLGIVAAGNGAG